MLPRHSASEFVRIVALGALLTGHLRVICHLGLDITMTLGANLRLTRTQEGTML